MKNTPVDQRAPRRLLLLPTSHHHPPSMSAHSKHCEQLAASLSEMLKRKLSLGAKILQVGGVEKMFRRVFKNVREGERLLKASQCYLWTTSGPIAGLLFISSEKVAFCSDRPIKFGDLLRSHYKVSIPLSKLSRALQRDKYLQLLTTDAFHFWFLGFLGFKRTLKCLQQAIISRS